MNKSKKNRMLILWGIFLIVAIVHIRISDFPKLMVVYPDELRYLSIAKSILHGEILIHNVKVDFQKILYSICIAPAFLFRSPILQVRGISWLNSIWMASAVFPAYFLADKIVDREWKRYLVVCFTGMMPATLLTMTFMSEVIFLPLSLWTINAGYCLIVEKNCLRKMCWGFIFGLLCYLSYLNKEIALYFVIAYCIIAVTTIVCCPNERKCESYSLICVLFSFFICYMVLKFTLFRGMGNSYNQMGIKDIFQTDKMIYMAYASVYNGLFALIAFGIFPVLVTFADLFTGYEKKRFSMFVLLSWVIGIAAIVYTISTREDFPNQSIRQHIRYLEPLLIPFMLLMLMRAEHVSKKIILTSTVILGLLVLVFLRRVGAGSMVDQQSLLYYNKVIDKINFLHKQSFDVGEWLTKLMIVLVMILGGMIICCKDGAAFLKGFIVAFCAVNIINFRTGYIMLRSEYGITEEVQMQMEKAAEMIKGLNGNVLFLSPHGLEEDNRLIDTFLIGDVYVTSFEYPEMDTYISDGVISLDTECLFVEWPWGYYDNLKTIDYIIVNQEQSLGNVKKLDGFSMPGFSIYKNLTPNIIYISN